MTANKILALCAALPLGACSYFSTPGTAAFQTAPAAAPQQLDELMSAQAAFRQALSTQNSGDSVIVRLQGKLADAQQRKAEAEADIARLSSELDAVQQNKTAHDAALKAAGERLNAAWQAAHTARP